LHRFVDGVPDVQIAVQVIVACSSGDVNTRPSPFSGGSPARQSAGTFAVEPKRSLA